MKKEKLLQFLKNEKLNGENLFTTIKNFLIEEYGQKEKNFRRSSPFGMILRVVVNLFQLVFFYLEDSIVESNILTASRGSSIRGIATLTGHSPQRRVSATGTVSLNDISTSLEGNIVLSNLTRIKNLDNGLKYTLLLPDDFIEIDLSDFTSLESVPVIQGEFESSVFTSNGKALQSFAVQKSGVEQFNVTVKVNGKIWTKVDSFLDLQLDEEGYYIKSGYDEGIEVYFGNGDMGKIPESGARIEITYLVSNGTMGEIVESTDWEFEDPGFDDMGEEVDLDEAFSIEVKDPIIFASNPESVQFTKLVAPKLSKTFSLITPDDYVYFLKRFDYFSTVQAFIGKDEEENSNVVNLLLIPNLKRRLTSGETYFDLDESHFKISEIEKERVRRFLTKRATQAPATDLKFVDPKIKKFAIDIIVRCFDDVERSAVSAKIKEKISDYFLNLTRRDLIPSSDFVYMIEKIDGVDSVNVFFVSKENEKRHIEDGTFKSSGSSPIGLDKMNDIVIGEKDLVTIQGGWEDRYGQTYSNKFKSYEHKDISDILDSDERTNKGAVTLFFQPDIERNLNAEFLQSQLER